MSSLARQDKMLGGKDRSRPYSFSQSLALRQNSVYEGLLAFPPPHTLFCRNRAVHLLLRGPYEHGFGGRAGAQG